MRMRENFSAVIGARINEFRQKMAQVDAAVRKTALATDKPIGADISEFLRKMALVRSAVTALNRRAIVDIDARVTNFQGKMDRIATTIRSLSTVIANQLGGAFLSLSPTLAPIIATLTGALANLGPMIGTISGSAFALASAFGFAGVAGIGFASIMTSNLKSVFTASSDLKDLQEKLDATTDLKERNKLLEEMAQIQGSLNENQTKALNSMNKLSEIWSKTTKQFEGQSIDLFSRGMDLLGRTIERLNPLFKGTFKAVENLMTSLEKSFDSSSAVAFFDTLNTTGGGLLETLGKAFGNFTQGIFNMMVAFAPLTKTTTEGFLAMSDRFEEWSSKLSESKGFNSFVDYVNENMPKVRAIFRDAIAGIIYLFAGFSASSSGMMDGLVDMMSRFKNWASELGSNQSFQKFLGYISDNAPKVIGMIGNLTTFLVNLGIGLAPVGSMLLDLVNRFLSWTNSLMENNRVIGTIISVITVMAGLFLALVPTIVAITTLFSGFGTLIAKLATGSLGILKKAFNFLLSPIRNVALTLMLLGKGALVSVIAPVLAVVAVIGVLIAVFVRLWKENETFRENVITVWTAIKNAIVTAATAVADFVMSIIGKLSSWWAENQEFFKTSAKTAWDFIYTNIVKAMQGVWDFLVQAYTFLQPFIAAAWQMISQAVDSAWAFIKTVVTAGTDIVLSLINTFMALLGGDWSRAWTEIKNILSISWGLIKDLVKIGIDFLTGIFKSGFKLLLDITLSIWNSIGSKIAESWLKIQERTSTILAAVVGYIGKKWDEAKSYTVTKLTDLASSALNLFTSLKNYANNKFEETKALIISKLAEAVNGAKNQLTAMLTAAVTSFTTIVSNVRNKMEETKQAILNKLTEAVVGARNRLTNMLTAVVTSFTTIVSNVRNKMEEVKQWVSNKWEEAKSLASAKLEVLIRTVTNSFTRVVSAIREKMSEAVAKVGEKVAEMPGKVTAFVGAMVSAGADLIRGLIDGVIGAASGAVQAVKDVASNMIEGAKNVLAIFSPSRVFKAIGEFVGIGLVIGVNGTVKAVKRAGEALGEAVIPDLSSQIKTNESQIKSHNNTLIQINKAAAEQISKIEKDKTWEVRKVYQQADADRLSSTKQFISDKNSLEQLSLKDEVRIWEETVKAFQYASDEKRAAQLALRDAKRALDAEMLKMELNYIAEKKRLGEISLADEVHMLEALSTKYAVESEKHKQIQQQKADVLKQINDKMVAVQQDYLSKTKSINDEMIAEEKRLTDAYQKSVDDRAQSLYAFTGLFDQLSSSFEGSGQDLINNLKGQVEGFKDWSADIANLARKGVDEGLLEELRLMGPKAYSEIAALNSLSEEQLSQYQALWKEKSTLAREQAVGELEGLRKDTQSQIENLHHKTAEQLELIRLEWASKIKAVTEGTAEQLMTLESIGADAIKGLMNGMASMEGDLLAKARGIADSIAATIKKALDINSPSRVLEKLGEFAGSGLIRGLGSNVSLCSDF